MNDSSPGCRERVSYSFLEFYNRAQNLHLNCVNGYLPKETSSHDLRHFRLFSTTLQPGFPQAL